MRAKSNRHPPEAGWSNGCSSSMACTLRMVPEENGTRTTQVESGLMRINQHCKA